MKCQIPLPGKNKKKYFKMSSAENFTRCAISFNLTIYIHKYAEVYDIISYVGLA